LVERQCGGCGGGGGSWVAARWRWQLGSRSFAVALAVWQGGDNIATVAAARLWQHGRQNGGGGGCVAAATAETVWR
jgi:hypothetical protein